MDGLGSGMLATANVSAGPVKDAATCAEHRQMHGGGVGGGDRSTRHSTGDLHAMVVLCIVIEVSRREQFKVMAAQHSHE